MTLRCQVVYLIKPVFFKQTQEKKRIQNIPGMQDNFAG